MLRVPKAVSAASGEYWRVAGVWSVWQVCVSGMAGVRGVQRIYVFACVCSKYVADTVRSEKSGKCNFPLKCIYNLNLFNRKTVKYSQMHIRYIRVGGVVDV